jgi:hypothetical protein
MSILPILCIAATLCTISLYEEYNLTQDTHNQESSTRNGAQSGRNTKTGRTDIL